MTDSNKPIKFEPVDRASLFNAMLAQAGYALNQLRNTVGDGTANALTPETLNQNALKNISKENKDQSKEDTPTLVLGNGKGSLVEKYNLTNQKQNDFRSEWNDMDTKIIDMSKVSAELANNVKEMIEPGLRDQIIGVRDTVAAGKRDAVYGKDPSTGKQVVVGYGEIVAQTQLWGVWRLDNIIDEAATSVQQAQDQFQAHPTDPLPVITPTYSYTPTPTYQTPWTNSGNRYQPVASSSYARPLGKGEVAQAKALYDHLKGKIYDYWVSRGKSPAEANQLASAQTAGILGNLEVESGFNTSSWNSGEGAFGLAQWEGNRLSSMKEWMARNGRSITDPNAQVDYLWSELQGSESGAWAQVSQQSSPQGAAAAFDQYYERSSGAARGQRMGDAEQIFKQVATTS